MIAREEFLWERRIQKHEICILKFPTTEIGCSNICIGERPKNWLLAMGVAQEGVPAHPAVIFGPLAPSLIDCLPDCSRVLL